MQLGEDDCPSCVAFGVEPVLRPDIDAGRDQGARRRVIQEEAPGLRGLGSEAWLIQRAAVHGDHATEALESLIELGAATAAERDRDPLSAAPRCRFEGGRITLDQLELPCVPERFVEM